MWGRRGTLRPRESKSFLEHGTVIKPTVGRIVDYWPDGFVEGIQPRAAQIAWVWSDTCVNIGFLDEMGIHGNATSVDLWQGEGERPDHAHCSWMPYQVGQAKKDATA